MNTIVLMCTVLLGCGRGAGERAHGAEEHGEHHDEHAAGARVVHLSPQALKRNGIALASAGTERLVGGIDVPAEVKLNPDMVAHVTPLVAGQIIRVKKSLGDRVKARDVLAVIKSVALGKARAELSRAAAAVRLARAEYRRQKTLEKEGIGARRKLIEARAALERARAEQTASYSSLRVYNAAGSAGAEVKIRSPFDGVIIQRHATNGEVVGSDKPMFVVANLTKVWVVGRVYEQDVAAIHKGAAVSVTLEAYPGRSWPGTIDYVAPVLDERTRTLGIRTELDNTDGSLRPGLFGNIALSPPGAPDKPVVAVPETALTSLGENTVVFIPGDKTGEFHARSVSVGVRARGFVEIRSGLEAGARVVVAGVFVLKSELMKDSLGGGHAH